MAKYTVELREILENGTNIGLNTYPIWVEDYRPYLNKKIIDHYKYREIGFETVGRFVEELNIKMNEIMPYYNKLYATTLINYNPLDIVDYTEDYTIAKNNEITKTGTLANTETGSSEGTGTVAGQTSSTSNETTNSTNEGSKSNITKNVENDTPGTPLASETIDTFTHASKITHNKDVENTTNETENVGTSTTTGQDNTTTTTNSELTNSLDSESHNLENEQGQETMSKHIKGNYTSVSFQNLIKQERDIILNIDMLVIGQLNDLFLTIW